jgi:aromatic ring-opening dioxygenase LigB subunit
MLIHAAFMPHSPLLLKEVHPERHREISVTLKAIDCVAKDLYSLKPDVLCVISGHGERVADAFSIDVSDSYETNLKQFGDLSDPTIHEPALDLADKLQRHLRKNEVPFTLNTNEVLDYGTAVILRLLPKIAEKTKLLPIAYAELEPKEQIRFGQSLREVLDECAQRVAVVAIGDLSHSLSSDSPGEFHKDGKIFDDAIARAVAQGSLSNLLAIKKDVVENAHESGYLPLLILYGLLDKRAFASELMSYESPFGVGYLVAQFHLM